SLFSLLFPLLLSLQAFFLPPGALPCSFRRSLLSVQTAALPVPPVLPSFQDPASAQDFDKSLPFLPAPLSFSFPSPAILLTSARFLPSPSFLLVPGSSSAASHSVQKSPFLLSLLR